MSAMKHYLTSHIKGDSPWSVPLEKEDTIIGRSTECQIILNAPSVSRRHCIIKMRGNAVRLLDLESKNGSFVNGVKLNGERELRHNDLIRLGELELLYEQHSSDSELDDDENEEEKTQIDIKKQHEEGFIQKYRISQREEEVLYLLIKGLKVKDISERLFISAGTAKNHVLSIYSKTDCHSRIELASLYQDYK